MGTLVFNEVCKSLRMDYNFVDVFEFWEYNMTCFDNDKISGCLFAQYVTMFLKLEQETSGYPSCVHNDEVRDKYIEVYLRAERML